MVELRVTVIDPTRPGTTVDLLVACERGTTLAEVTPQLLAAVDREAPDNACRATVFLHEGVPVPGALPVGAAPLLDGAVLRVQGATSEPVREPGLLTAHVVAGPDAGRIVSLPPGEHRVGRAPGCSVRLDDPDASRVHASLRVAAEGTTLTDLGSTHGTFLDDERLGPEPVSLGPAQPVRVGGSVLLLRRPDLTPAALTPDGAGHLLVNRRPHLRPGPEERSVEFPATPDERPPAKLPWLVMLLPMAVSLVVAAVLRQPLFLLFALTTPALMAGQYLTERRAGGRERRERAAAYEVAQETAERDLERALKTDAALQEAALPDLALLALTAQVPGGDLWVRAPGGRDHLHVRLGRGPGPSRVRRTGPGVARGEGPVLHPDVPIGLELTACAVVGICGPGRSSLARSLVGQLATQQSPQDLAIEVAGPGANAVEWSFVRWLPHHPGVGAGPDRSSTAAPLRVTVLDGAARLRRLPGVAGLLAGATRADHGPRREIVICLAEQAAELPMECVATVELLVPAPADAGRRAVLRRSSAPAQEFRPDLPGPAWAEQLARALAPLRDATPQPGSLPACPALPDLLTDVDGVRVDDAHALARHWRREPSSPSATVGLGPAGPIRIDLRRDGPHALIGGTTGAGKSELLLSLVTALAADRGPDETSFLLVDYKGGAAFQACADLPHVAGLITDLDPHLAGRALDSLRAELRRRERLLASAGAADLDAYRGIRLTARGTGSGDPPNPPSALLPRLVVVVDEFRVLAEELPDFVSGLVRIAAVGRSLGVHLVLATQRPAGVVSPEIRANAALRIALRVRDAADSHDLIETADAAAIPARSPGRAIARIAGELTPFQVSSVLAPRRRARPPSVRRLDAAPEPATADRDAGPGTPGESDQIVVAMRDATTLLGLPPVERPWLPPLPNHLPLRDLLETIEPDETIPAAGEAPVAVIGMADLPEAQHQEAVAWTSVAGHLGVLGGPRSGRTTALLTVAYSLAARYRADELHLYAIDAGGGAGTGQGLDDLARLPHCGAVVPAADSERSARLLAWLRDLIDGQRPHRPVVLLVDGWESLTARWAGVDHGLLIEQLTAVLRDGARHGIHVAVAGGRSLLTGQVPSLLSERLVLRFADPTDAVLAGVRNVGPQPPGRGVLVRTGDPEGRETHIATVDFAIAADPDPIGGPWRLRALPQVVRYGIIEAVRPAGTGLQVPLGVGGDAAEPLLLDLDRPGVTLIHGSPGSGRTAALAVIEAGVVAAGSTVFRVPGSDPRDLVPALAGDPDAVVLVDDVTRLGDPTLEQALVERVRTRPDRPRIVVGAGPGDVVTAFRGLAAEARTSRYGLVLGAFGPADAGVLGIGSTSRPAGPPGRGRLVDGADSVPVQVALPAPVRQPV